MGLPKKPPVGPSKRFAGSVWITVKPFRVQNISELSKTQNNDNSWIRPAFGPSPNVPLWPWLKTLCLCHNLSPHEFIAVA